MHCILSTLVDMSDYRQRRAKVLKYHQGQVNLIREALDDGVRVKEADICSIMRSMLANRAHIQLLQMFDLYAIKGFYNRLVQTGRSDSYAFNHTVQMFCAGKLMLYDMFTNYSRYF